MSQRITKKFLLAIMLVFAFSICFQSAAFATDFDVVEIPELGGANIQEITGFNNLGHVIGYTNDSKSFVWSNGIIAYLGSLQTNDSFPSFTYAKAINNKSQITGNTANYGSVSHSFQWESGVIKDLGVNDYELRFFTYARDINDYGSVVGITTNWGTTNGLYLFKDGIVTIIGSTMQGIANVLINNKEQVMYNVVDFADRIYHAYIWENGVSTEFATGYDVQVLGFNDKSQSIGYIKDQNGKYVITLWENGLTKPLGEGIGFDINNFSQVVGIMSTNSDHPFFLDITTNEQVDLYEKIRLVVESNYYPYTTFINDKGQILLSGFSQIPYTRRTFILSPTGLFCQTR